MKVLRRAVLVVAVGLGLPLGIQAQETPELPADLVEARAALLSAYEALRLADAPRHWSDDIDIHFMGDLYRGRSAATALIHDALSGATSLRFGTPRFTVRTDEVVESSGYAIGMPDGQQHEGTYEAVWRLHDGRWLVTRMNVQ
jgi:hypothetical protein